MEWHNMVFQLVAVRKSYPENNLNKNEEPTRERVLPKLTVVQKLFIV